MFNVAFKIIGDEDAVRDIVQEIFISYYEKTKSKTVILQLQSWLLKATVNKSIDYLNRKKKHVDLSAASQVEEEEDKMMEEQQKQAVLRKALSRLNEQEMKLAVLYSEGPSCKEIAELSGIKLNSIGKTLSRTLQKLKEILKQMNYEMY
jgi:RNA polymerase sigma-70 factor (ECF subfamily)